MSKNIQMFLYKIMQMRGPGFSKYNTLRTVIQTNFQDLTHANFSFEKISNMLVCIVKLLCMPICICILIQTFQKQNQYMTKQCTKHNLPEQVICIGEQCHRRVGCQLCMDKHDHKFYLDTKNKLKQTPDVQKQLNNKLLHLQKYTRANIDNLRLQRYKQQIEKKYNEERIYFKNKIDEETMNIMLWFEKITKNFNTLIDNLEEGFHKNWDQYNGSAMKYKKQAEEYEALRKYFEEGDWTTHNHVEKSVNMLYSEELYFQFNRNLDILKKQINHHKKEDQQVLNWFQERREQFIKTEICPHKKLGVILQSYSKSPVLSEFKEPETKQFKNDRQSLLNMIREQQKVLLLYPQTTYEPFQSIYKIIRYDNQIFATSGGRAVNIWTRVSVQPEKTYPLNFPSYGILSFIQYGKDEPQQIVFGKSNGQLGLLNIAKQQIKEMPSHESAIRDILQFDSYHFLTASQDWKIKLWAMSDPKEKYFASERLCLSGHSGRVYSLCKFGPNVLAGGTDGTIKLWDISRESYDQVFQQQKQIYALSELRPELFISGGEIKEIRVWDYRKTKAHVISHPIQHTCNSIMKYDANTIIFNDKHMVKVIDIRNYKQPTLIMNNNSVFSHGINSMVYLSDNQIGMGGSDNYVTIWKY